jgi:uncharacterized protein YifE (UPF0438 family)
MNDDNAFISNRRFYAEEHFPYGIAGSGEFSYQQARLLENHGWAYQDLHTGARAPSNDEERRFVEVCQGREFATSIHETTWLRYCEKTQTKAVRKPFSGRPQSLTGKTYYDTNDEW